MIAGIFIMLLLLINVILFSHVSSLTITNSPSNVTVCTNAMAEINCGFTGADPDFVIPNWRIIMRSDNGTIVSNKTVLGDSITANRVSGLKWVPDRNDATNSKLLVGPVNETHNQSSYQCYFTTTQNQNFVSDGIGTITVVGPPFIDITVDKTCTTSIIVSLTINSHPACGNVSYSVTLRTSGTAVATSPTTINGLSYGFNELTDDTDYMITVISIHNNVSETFNTSTRTLVLQSPNNVDINSISISQPNCSTVIIAWKPPVIDECLMLPIQYYNVRINSSEDEIVSTEINIIDDEQINLCEHLQYHSLTAITINITVVDRGGLRSHPTVKTINIQSIHTTDNGEDDNMTSMNKNDEGNNEILIGLTVLFATTSLITTAIIVMLSWKLHNQQRQKEVKISPTKQNLNVDNIVMQASPAYVPFSQDNKDPSTVAEYEIVQAHVD